MGFIWLTLIIILDILFGPDKKKKDNSKVTLYSAILQNNKNKKQN